LYHHGQPGRRYEELKLIGEEMQRLGEQFLGAENRNPVAMILSYDTRWAFQIQPNHNDFKYPALFTSYYKALHARNIGVDIVPPGADLSQYRLVIAPALYILPDETADSLRSFVQNGGTLIATARSGVKDEANAIVNQYLPGLLADICGVEVDEYDVQPADATVPLELTFPDQEIQTAQSRLWFDVLRTTTAQTLATYQGEYFSGAPAITLNHHGQGKAIYVGTLGDDALPDTILDWVLKSADLHSALAAPLGVEVTERWQGDRRLLFLLNHTDETQEVPITQPYLDLLRNTVVNEVVKMPPYGVSVLREQG
jgi:beta-galactosidase